MSEQTNAKIIESYHELEPTLKFVADTAWAALQKKVEESGMMCAGVTGRVKAEESLAGKLARKGTYKSVLDVTDLVGLRVITYFVDDVERVAQIVEELFDVEEKDIEDKRSKLAATQFGYLSLHCLCRLPEGMCDEDAYPLSGTLRFEVQMRSALQHVWAEIEHDTGYKAEIECPRTWRRSFSRVASLFELADDEFVRIRDGLDRYRHDAHVLIEHGRLDEVALDGDTWNAWLETHPFDELNERIAKINDSEIYDVDMLGYLPAFEMLEFSTIGDLKRMVDEDSERAFDLAERQLGGTGLDIVSSTVGLQNLCVAHALKMGMGEVGLRLLFESLGTSSHYAARRAQSVLRLCE